MSRNRKCRGCKKIRVMDLPHHCFDCSRPRRELAALRAAQARVCKWTFRQLRAEALMVYGSQCAACGSVDSLEFDHVNGDGRDHRAKEHVRVMLRRICVLQGPLPDYNLQLLCSSCHLEKTREEARTRERLRRSSK